MITIKPIKIKSITTETPIDLFLKNESSIQGFNRSICFYRVIGIAGTDNDYIEQIKAIDYAAANMAYIRINRLDTPPPEALQRYFAMYDIWIQAQNAMPDDIIKLPFILDLPDKTLEWSAKYAFHLILRMYREYTHQITESMLKTFLIKMLYWIEKYLKPVFTGSCFPKIVVTGDIKKQESIFLLYCSNIGCDILYINPNADLTDQYPDLLGRSRLHIAGTRRVCTIPIPEHVKIDNRKSIVQKSQAAACISPIPVMTEQTVKNTSTEDRPENRKSLTYEELAEFSSSVVMISVFDNNKQCIKTGSGVVVSEKGFILTNFHVVSNGAYYSVRFENESEDYWTDSLIKYHTNYDLAVICVEKSCKPIYIAQNERLLRGQKIVAIGSPLGLFNTVSDGIISGFRQINDNDMIQFTAPISSGSSGGALMDMRGRLIGIITAGIDAGQNLNLAVNYNIIYNFIKPFIA